MASKTFHISPGAARLASFTTPNPSSSSPSARCKLSLPEMFPQELHRLRSYIHTRTHIVMHVASLRCYFRPCVTHYPISQFIHPSE